VDAPTGGRAGWSVGSSAPILTLRISCEGEMDYGSRRKDTITGFQGVQIFECILYWLLYRCLRRCVVIVAVVVVVVVTVIVVVVLATVVVVLAIIAVVSVVAWSS